MADIEKVIKAMEECIKYDYVCGKCPYKPNDDDETDCCRDLMMDALELLKEQQEKINKARLWLKADGVDLDEMCDKLN